MLYSTLMLMMSSAFLMLRLTPGGSFPRPLSEAEERKYLDAWLQGDLEARNVLIERNLRLVAHIIKKYYTHYDDTDDLISIGTIGLIKGINTYRPDKGVRLATYASKCAENEILMYFRSTRKNASEMLLSDVLDTDGDGNNLSLIDILSEDDDMDEHLQADEVSRALRRCIGEVLDAREAEIIRLRYAIGGGEALTQRETAQRCGISRSYVSRIEKKAIEKLRAALGKLAWHLLLFALAIAFAIPAGVKVSSMIEDTYRASIEETIANAEQTTEDIQSATSGEADESEKSGLSGLFSKVTEGITGAATAAVEQLKTVLNRFIEALAVMLVTSCLIPILVLLFFTWLVKLMLGIEPPPLRVKLGDGKAHSASGAPRI